MITKPTITKLLTIAELFDYSRKCGLRKPYSWQRVNYILNANYNDPWDFNAIPSWFISNMATLRKAAKAARDASMNPNAPWLIYKCVECGEDIILSRREVEWYRSSGIERPAYCQRCVNVTLGLEDGGEQGSEHEVDELEARLHAS